MGWLGTTLYVENGGAGHDAMTMENWTLMQGTGLKDKTGKEIYEGDIVRVEDGPNKKTRTVIFDAVDGSYALKLSNGATEYLPNYVRYGQIEIIGNIYEHPHLLTNEK